MKFNGMLTLSEISIPKHLSSAIWKSVYSAEYPIYTRLPKCNQIFGIVFIEAMGAILDGGASPVLTADFALLGALLVGQVLCAGAVPLPGRAGTAAEPQRQPLLVGS